MRIAWLGPAPTTDHGVPRLATVLLAGLAERGHRLDLYADFGRDPVPDELQRPEVRVIARRPPWRPDAWYSRTALSSFASGQLSRAGAQALLVRRIVEQHRTQPYDVLYQFSQFELLTARRFIDRLPPVVIHPQVHAAGELRWLDRERDVAPPVPAPKAAAVRAMLVRRSAAQRRDGRLAARLIAPSRAFASALAGDVGVPRASIGVVPNAVDLDRFSPGAAPPGERPVRLLFVARLSVRKGVEDIVALTHRLADLAGRVELVVAGGGGQWSDYEPLLQGLHPAIGRHVGIVASRDLPALYASAHAALQPSRYEPFALTSAEALACGTPVIGSDAVGALEDVSPDVGRRLPAGDLGRLEAAVRDVVASPPGEALRRLAREEAVRLFAPGRVASLLDDELAIAAGRAAA